MKYQALQEFVCLFLSFFLSWHKVQVTFSWSGIHFGNLATFGYRPAMKIEMYQYTRPPLLCGPPNNFIILA